MNRRIVKKHFIKILLPVFEQIFRLIFADMHKNKIDEKQIDWYMRIVAKLLSETIGPIYKDLEDYKKFEKMVENDFINFVKTNFEDRETKITDKNKMAQA